MSDITPTQLDLVKGEIIDALIASFVLDPSVGSSVPSRRSRRRLGGGDSGGGTDVEIVAAPDKESKRKRLESNQADRSLQAVSDESDDDYRGGREEDGSFDVDVALTTLRELPLERVGVLELAYNCAHCGDEYATVTRKLLDLKQNPIAEDEYKCITQISKSRLGRLLRNFQTRKHEISEGQIFKIKDGQLLLDYLYTCARLNNGENLPIKLCDSHGHLKPEQAFILRHILYTHPRIGLKNIIELYVCYHVAIIGKEPAKEDFPSTSTLRCHIAMLNAIDRHLQGQEIADSLNRLSLLGSKRHGAMLSDDTKHGNKENRHVLIVTADGEVMNRVHQWQVNPVFHVLANSEAVTKTSEGNSDLNLQCLTSNIPPATIARFNGQATDNAPDAKKEARLTFEKIWAFLTGNGLGAESTVNGVERRPILLGDPLHIDALAIKHASIGACGSTVKGKHDQMHHRQAIQNLADIFCRDPITIKDLFYQILGAVLVAILGLPHLLKERDARWMSNSRAAKEILKYLYVQDEEGTSFWVIFCREIQLLYTDFRLDRIGDEAQMLMAPTIIAGLHLEAELGDFFEMTHDFHAQKGQLADRPGFRSLELVALYVGYVLPYWEDAKNNPSTKFPDTYTYLDTITDPQLKQMKREQIESGILAGHAEIAKMTDQLLTAPWLLTLVTHPVHGPDVARAFYTVARDNGVAFFEDKSLIDWSFYRDGEVPTSKYEVFLAKAEQKKEETIHYMQQIGFMTVSVRDEVKRLTREQAGSRDPQSKTWLLDFAAEFPHLFDKLHAEFALFPSNTRIGEQLHRVERAAFDSQASHESAVARNNYIVGPQYEDRRVRREMSYKATNSSSTSTSTSTKRRKVAAKHNDRKPLLVKLGSQLKERASNYTQAKLRSNVPADVLKENSISRIKERGTDRDRKRLTEQKVAHSKHVAKKRVEKGFHQIPLEEQTLLSQKLRTEHDRSWLNRTQEQQYAKLKRMMFKSY